MEYTSEYSFFERGKKVRGVGFKTSGGAWLVITLDQGYPDFLVGRSSCNVAVGTLLPGLSTLDKWTQSGTFWTRHDMERELRNDQTKILAEIRMELNRKIQGLTR